MKPARSELCEFPPDVRQDVGGILRAIQYGDTPPDCKSINEIGDGTMEIVLDDGDAYRVFYIARFEEAVYVLYCFNKKSKTGIETPKQDKETGKKRYKRAVAMHEEFIKEQAAKKKHGDYH